MPHNTYVSKANLVKFTDSLKKRLDVKYAPIEHKHRLEDLSYNAGEDFLDYRILPYADVENDLPGIVKLGEGHDMAAHGDHGHMLANIKEDGFMSKDHYVKLEGLENYEHPEGDGFNHIPMVGDLNVGKVLMAGPNPGECGWKSLDIVDGELPGLMPSDLFVSLRDHLNNEDLHKTEDDIAAIESIGDPSDLNTAASEIIPAINELLISIAGNKDMIDELEKKVGKASGAVTALNAEEFLKLNVGDLSEGTICYVLDTNGLTLNGKTYTGEPTSFIIIDRSGTGGQLEWMELSAMSPKMDAESIVFESNKMLTVHNVKDALELLSTEKVNKKGFVGNRVVVVDPDTSKNDILISSEVSIDELNSLLGIEGNVQDLLDAKCDITHTHTADQIADLEAMTELDIERALEQAFK